VITISVVSHAQNALVNRLVASLSEVESNTSIEILITENTPDEVELKQDRPGTDLKIRRNQGPQGFARNHNAVFAEAQGDYYCILNPDTIWIEPLFERLIALIENGTADVVAPLIVDLEGFPQDSFRDLPSPLELFQRRFLGRKLDPMPFGRDEIVHPEWIAGIFLFMRSELFRQLGGFDERYHLYFEDVDFCCRARLSGSKIAVDTSVKFVHQARRESRRNFRYLVWHLSSAVRFFTSPVYNQIRKMPHGV
jgi:N-acetylglucosaminyl-diphospho-decaprenol L-rhamnosyltransferase